MLGVVRKSFISYSKNFKQIRNYQWKFISVPPKKQIGIWLATMSGMTFGAVVLGGITRLTESGLSMTDWHLFKEMPPLSEEAWKLEFEKYQKYPEYKHIISERGSMGLSDFMKIWWMEYSHRMWGRAIGVAFALPATYFYFRGFLNKAMKIRVMIFGGLIGFQGLLGWYMVKSGLKETNSEGSIPRVSQYRLAAHLGSAIVLYSLFLWNAFSHLIDPINTTNFPKLKMIRGMTHGVKFFIFLTAISGAFVAGLDAGLTYNSWPKMADRWIPSDLFSIDPTWINLFENPTTVQFQHRCLGQFTGALVLGLWLVCQRNKSNLRYPVLLAANALGFAALCQIGLGISTLLNYVPTDLAVAHQSGSLVLLSTALFLSHSLRYIPK